MKIGNGVRAAGSVFLLALLLTSGGCGYKTDPVPPASVVPTAIDDLRYTIDEAGVRLTWTYPAETVKGSDLMDISAFDLYRAVIPLSDLCENCPIPFGEPLEIPGGVTTDANKKRVAEYRTSLLRSGHKYYFKVRSRTSWWADSGDSNIVSFVWHVPASAPSGVTIEPADSLITLGWQPVTSLIDGRALDSAVSYQVFRSEGGKDFKAAGDPVTVASFTDDQVVNGQKYFYKVQSLLSYQGNQVNGGVSEVVSATAVDKTPPAKVAGVTAVETKSGTRIFWDSAKDSQVAAYRVYRRAEGQKTGELLGEVSAAYTLFVDNKPPAGIRVYYSVTAIDQATPPNESAPSAEAAPK